MITKDYEIMIAKILVEKFNVPKEILWDNLNQPLTGTIFRMDAIDIAYLFLEVQRLFHLENKQEFLYSYGYLTIENICDMLREKSSITLIAKDCKI